MWKTVSARIRGATTELEEMGEETDGLAQGLSKYREEIMALSGVDISYALTKFFCKSDRICKK